MAYVDGAPCLFTGSIAPGAAGSRPPIDSPASSRPAMARYKGGPRSTPRRVMTRERIAARGFLVLPKRFVVERAVAWLNRCRRRGLGMTQPTSARFLTPPLRLAHGAQDMPQHDVIPNRLSQHLDEAAERQIETQHQAQLKGLPTDFRIGADVGYRGWRSCSDPSRRTSGHPAPPQEEHIDGETDGLIAQNDGRPNRHAGHAC